MKHLMAILALASCQPAHAGVYGPVLPAVPASMPSEFELGPDESVNDAAARYANYTRRAKDWRIGLEAAIAADIATTCIILSQGGRERNPIYGRNVSCGKVAAINAGFGLASWFLLGHLIKKDPRQAARAAKIATIVRGLVVGWNIGQIAK